MKGGKGNVQSRKESLLLLERHTPSNDSAELKDEHAVRDKNVQSIGRIPSSSKLDRHGTHSAFVLFPLLELDPNPFPPPLALPSYDASEAGPSSPLCSLSTAKRGFFFFFSFSPAAAAAVAAASASSDDTPSSISISLPVLDGFEKEEGR